jgi:hypothetical protein
MIMLIVTAPPFSQIHGAPLFHHFFHSVVLDSGSVVYSDA